MNILPIPYLDSSAGIRHLAASVDTELPQNLVTRTDFASTEAFVGMQLVHPQKPISGQRIAPTDTYAQADSSAVFD